MSEPVQPSAFERHYSPEELAEIWGLDRSTIRRMFRDEAGVLKYSNQAPGSRRREYVTLRIPASVAQKVHEARTR